MDTPIVKLRGEDCDTVYEPSEDSFLLIDALERDLKVLKRMKPLISVEIGSGSGVVVTALAMALNNNNHRSHFVAVDINPHACKATRETSIDNSVEVDIINMDLLTGVNGKNMFDIIIFNPPYVVTESVEVSDEALISKTWAGGRNGREVMDRVFAEIPNLLTDQGMFYLVVIKENDPQDIIDKFREMNMMGIVVLERKVRGEHLHVLRFSKIKEENENS